MTTEMETRTNQYASYYFWWWWQTSCRRVIFFQVKKSVQREVLSTFSFETSEQTTHSRDLCVQETNDGWQYQTHHHHRYHPSSEYCSTMYALYSHDCCQPTISYGNKYPHGKCLFSFDRLLSILGGLQCLVDFLSFHSGGVLWWLSSRSMVAGFRQLFNYLLIGNDYDQSVSSPHLSEQTHFQAKNTLVVFVVGSMDIGLLAVYSPTGSGHTGNQKETIDVPTTFCFLGMFHRRTGNLFDSVLQFFHSGHRSYLYQWILQLCHLSTSTLILPTGSSRSWRR